MSDLWGSIFTPGATPTLLLATNVTFGFLQLTLAGLLAATLSIHFVILSILCAGLWWAINWFAHELQAAQAKEEEANRIRRSRQSDAGGENDGAQGRDWKTSGEVGDSADDEGTETEGDNLRASREEVEFVPSAQDEEIRQRVLADLSKSGQATMGSGLAPSGGEARQRRTGGDMSGEVSTDSEWEKVDNDR